MSNGIPAEGYRIQHVKFRLKLFEVSSSRQCSYSLIPALYYLPRDEKVESTILASGRKPRVYHVVQSVQRTERKFRIQRSKRSNPSDARPVNHITEWKNVAGTRGRTDNFVPFCFGALGALRSATTNERLSEIGNYFPEIKCSFHLATARSHSYHVRAHYCYM